MKEGQKPIYYLAADSKQAAETAPFTEQLVRKGFEVRDTPLGRLAVPAHFATNTPSSAAPLMEITNPAPCHRCHWAAALRESGPSANAQLHREQRADPSERVLNVLRRLPPDKNP